MIRFLLAPLAAVLGAIWAGRGLLRRRPAPPRPGAAAVVGFLSPPLVGAWFDRPFLEQALAVTAATIGYGAVLLSLAVVAGPARAQGREPIKIGLAAAVSGGSAASGEAIKRGLQIALDEINGRGGVLGGRRLELVIRDDEGNPAKGVTIARELIEREKVAVVFGGLHTTVALAQVPVWHELRTPYMGVWAAGTNITRNAPGVVGPNRTEDLEKLADAMIRFGYPAFEHNFGLRYDRRRDSQMQLRGIAYARENGFPLLN